MLPKKYKHFNVFVFLLKRFNYICLIRIKNYKQFNE